MDVIDSYDLDLPADDLQALRNLRSSEVVEVWASRKSLPPGDRFDRADFYRIEGLLLRGKADFLLFSIPRTFPDGYDEFAIGIKEVPTSSFRTSDWDLIARSGYNAPVPFSQVAIFASNKEAYRIKQQLVLRNRKQEARYMHKFDTGILIRSDAEQILILSHRASPFVIEICSSGAVIDRELNECELIEV